MANFEIFIYELIFLYYKFIIPKDDYLRLYFKTFEISFN